MRTSRRLLLALIAAPLLSAIAADAATVRGGGWSIAWPSEMVRAPLAPGTVVRVGVTPPSGAAARRAPRAKATVTLTRLPAAGRAGRVVAERRLRRGTARLRIPRGTGPRYRLTVRAGGRALARALLRTAAPRRAAPPKRATPPRTAPPASACPSDGTRAATMSLSSTVVRNDETITLTIVNTGTGCLTTGHDYRWEQELVPVGLQPVVTGEVFPSETVTILPGSSWSLPVRVPAAAVLSGAAPRLVKSVGPRDSAGGELLLTAVLSLVSDTPRCPDSGPASATITAGQATYVGVEPVVLKVVNDGARCIWLSGPPTLQRTVGGIESPVTPSPFVLDPSAGNRLWPGETRTFRASGLLPGRYRAQLNASSANSDMMIPLLPSPAEFEVTTLPE